MKNNLLIIAGLVWASGAAAAFSADWIVAPSYYTHDPTTGQRVSQYQPVAPAITYSRADYLRSGYRHSRSSIQAGGSSDHLHIVEEWGRPIRPYGEWRFPYRPFSVPYSAWGPPYAGLGNGGAYYPGYFPPMPWSRPNNQTNAPPAGAFSTVPPWAEGSYPQYQSGLPDLRRQGPRAQRGPGRPHAHPTPSGKTPKS